MYVWDIVMMPAFALLISSTSVLWGFGPSTLYMYVCTLNRWRTLENNIVRISPYTKSNTYLLAEYLPCRLRKTANGDCIIIFLLGLKFEYALYYVLCRYAND
ncbi:hypothetical protein F4779DRAFT_584251 [Xylariaceae sp. FL0662B]|nr:hypothetical protein F4779DRAFT_584251 [Xylariaceae sp. FL0662B]